jgi:hypothetical protein|tara:strand:+ start:744 stop:896 length:153 start_codon:yes stop_codon:yes gene_type:complete
MANHAGQQANRLTHAVGGEAELRPSYGSHDRSTSDNCHRGPAGLKLLNAE